MAVIPNAVRGPLVRAFREEKCIPFVGAGACTSHNGTPGLPTGGELSEALAKELLDLKIRIDDIGNIRNLLEVSTHYQHSRSRNDLIGSLKNRLPHEAMKPLPVHVALSKLPLKLVITTNYDTLMERAMKAVDRDYRQVIQPIAGFPDDVLQAQLIDESRPIVYKVHGSFGDEKDNFVITEDDYLSFLVQMTKPQLGIPTAISGRLATHVLLFLGYGLADWDFRVLFKMVEQYPAHVRPGSFAVMKQCSDFMRNYWAKKSVTVIEADAHEFADELLQAYLDDKAKTP